MCFVVSLISCGNEKNIKEEKTENSIIGFVSGSNSEFATKSYVKDGAQLIDYNTLSDLLLAIENGYVDYGVLSDYEYVLAENAERKIEVYEECSFKMELCAYFRSDAIELCNQFNDFVKSMKDKGIIDKIKNSEYNGIAYHSSYTGKGENELKVLCNPSVNLFMYMPEEGYYSGIDVDILETFAEENNYSISYISEFDDDELYSKLQSGDGDMVISACLFNSKRAEKFLASDSYLTIKFNLVTRKTF